MKNGMFRIGIAATVLGVAFLGCQTTGQVASENSIRTEQAGLAPAGAAQHSTIDFSLSFANRGSIRSWKVEAVIGGHPQKRWKGDATSLPTTMTWDGKGDSGTVAPEGAYTARLTVDYATGNPVSVQSQVFILDVSSPTGSVTFNPPQFAPAEGGGDAVEPVSIVIDGKSPAARMDSWSLDIFDQNGQYFRSFDGKWPGTTVLWDGKSSSGNWVVPTQSYSVLVTLRDEFGNSAQVSGGITVAGAKR